MDVEQLAGTVGEWLKGTGPESDIVISTRVRLARNVQGELFVNRASPPQRGKLEKELREAIEAAGILSKVLYFGMDAASELDRAFLVERHLISRDLAVGEGARGVAVNPSENVSIMVNEEDHLRIQVIKSGLQTRPTWSRINRIDDMLEKQVAYAFSPQLGYLTACPTNVGTAMRVSVMMHLPALVITKEIERVFYAVSKINLAVRGLFGEGSQAASDFFQISNQIALGRTEEQILQTIEGVIPNIIEYERRSRDALLRESRAKLEDRVWRAYGTLKYAHLISSEETMEKLSSLRLGINLGIIKDVDIKTVNELFILTQPAHLQKHARRALEPKERDPVRAEFIRKRLTEPHKG